MSALALTGLVGLAVLGIGWLVVSFTAPSPRRTRVEWIAACGLYVALLSLFAHLLGKALAKHSTAGSLGFGFLVLFFAVGLVVCVAHAVAAVRGRRKSSESATN